MKQNIGCLGEKEMAALSLVDRSNKRRRRRLIAKNIVEIVFHKFQYCFEINLYIIFLIKFSLVESQYYSYLKNCTQIGTFVLTSTSCTAGTSDLTGALTAGTDCDWVAMGFLVLDKFTLCKRKMLFEHLFGKYESSLESLKS